MSKIFVLPIILMLVAAATLPSSKADVNVTITLNSDTNYTYTDNPDPQNYTNRVVNLPLTEDWNVTFTTTGSYTLMFKTNSTQDTPSEQPGESPYAGNWLEVGFDGAVFDTVTYRSDLNSFSSWSALDGTSHATDVIKYYSANHTLVCDGHAVAVYVTNQTLTHIYIEMDTYASDNDLEIQFGLPEQTQAEWNMAILFPVIFGLLPLMLIMKLLRRF